MNSLYEAIAFEENPLYERIISDITTQNYSIVDDFFLRKKFYFLGNL